MEIPWTFFRKAALVLFGISLLAGFGSTALFMGHRLPVETWRIIFILALVLLTITSTVLIPGLLLPNITSPHPEFLSDDLQDEWTRTAAAHDLPAAHPPLGRGDLGPGLSLVHLLLRKADQCVLVRLDAGRRRRHRSLPPVVCLRAKDRLVQQPVFTETPTWVMLVAFAGFAAALFLGIFMTEQVPPAQNDQSLTAEQNVDYGYVGSRAYYITRQYLNFGPTPEITFPDCDDDACAYVFLAMLFVLLTAILVAGAALIPHMWVLSCLVLLTLIALLALHEIRRDRSLRGALPERHGTSGLRS